MAMCILGAGFSNSIIKGSWVMGISRDSRIQRGLKAWKHIGFARSRVEVIILWH